MSGEVNVIIADAKEYFIKHLRQYDVYTFSYEPKIRNFIRFTTECSYAQ